MNAREVMKSVGLTEADCDCVEQALAAAGYAVLPMEQLESLCRLIGNGTWRDKTGCPLETSPQFDNLQAMIAAAKGEA